MAYVVKRCNEHVLTTGENLWKCPYSKYYFGLFWSYAYWAHYLRRTAAIPARDDEPLAMNHLLERA